MVNKHTTDAAEFTDASQIDMKDQVSTSGHQQAQGQTGFNFSEYDAKDEKQTKAKEYLEELAQQVREKKQQKQREKDESDRLDKKFEVDNANFNPYGRAGCGAPLKSRGGETMANLRQAAPFQYSSNSQQEIEQYNQYDQRGNTNNNNNNNNNNPNEQKYFPRGAGKGAFGVDDKTDEKKRQDEKYKEELRKQIEDNQRKKQFDKEQLRLEDERDKRIDQEHRQHEADLEEAERRRRHNNNNQGFNENPRRMTEQNSNGDNQMPNKAATRKLEPRPF